MESTDALKINVEKLEQGEKEVLSHQSVDAMIIDGELSGDAVDPSHLMNKQEPHKRRVLHFSDGILEEFSSDEEYQVDSAPAKITEPPVDPKTLSWGPWILYQTTAAGGAALKVCDYLGESLANLFGITTPKYEYEIEEYKRTIEEEAERKKKEDLEMGGWREEPGAAPQLEGPMKGEIHKEDNSKGAEAERY